MKLLINTTNAKCDNTDCGMSAKYKIVSNCSKEKKVLYICSECLSNLYASIGRVLIPASPNAPFKPKKNNIGEF